MYCMDRNRRTLWQDWVNDHLPEGDIPLFETDDNLRVKTTRFGRGDAERDVLKRGQEISKRIIDKASILEEDLESRSGQFEGLIYLMYWKEDQEIRPLYVGKTSKFNTTGYEINPNIESLATRENRFARWGYGKAWHLGELSNAILRSSWLESGEFTDKSINKKQWAETLFRPETRILRNQTYLWIDTWSVDDEGPFSSKTGTHPNLAELEYQLIGLTDSLYPDLLLNEEGTNQ